MCLLARRGWASSGEGCPPILEVSTNPRHQGSCVQTDVVDDDRNRHPAALLKPRRLDAIVLQRLRAGVPLHALVLCDDHCLRPREVDSPELAVPIANLVLEAGSGSPPSMKTSRASLSIGDSERPSACTNISRTRTIPRRPFCSRAAASSSAAVQASTCSAASKTANARGRRRVRATSTAVHAGAVANRPCTLESNAPVR
jgi:hypothetical protein